MSNRLFRCAGWLLQLCMAGAAADPATAQQDYPSRPIKIIASASAGGTTDLLARAVGERLAEALRQPVIVENRSSASGVVAAEATLIAAPDGYTLLATWHTHTISATMGPKLSYHPVDSFTPITQLASAGLLLVDLPTAPPRNRQDLME